ncbi:MAG TPA: zinc ribbon domain-containing protein [Gaiellaceae bacterium]|nr:zinc ribbon domain-containing protein [Gaiellaceae bacterium]
MPARLSSLFGRRPQPAPPPAEPLAEDGSPPEAPPPPSSPTVPVAIEMRRERRELARRREIEMRDVGGLAVEMVRRDRFKPDLLVERANEVLLVEQRMHELDSLLASEVAVRGLRHVPYCKCGAPLPPGVHFCAHCGRPSQAAPALLTCTHCGQPLPAETNFCPFCGHPVAAEEYLAETGGGESPESTLVRPAPGRERAEGA